MNLPHFGQSRQETPVVYSRGYDRDLPPGIRYGPVIRDIYYFECNTAGYGSIIINGREFPIRPGDCYFILPGDTVIYTTDFENPREGVWCSVDGLQVGRALAQAGISSENPYAPPSLFQELTAEVDAIARTFSENDPGAALRRTAHIYTFLGILLRNANTSGSTDWLSRVMGYMESHYNQPITVEKLAKEAFLERAYFSTQFKELTGQSPHAYLTSLRIQKACTLLQQTQCPVSKAAELVGLDPRNFARIFKRETGKTPKNYKSTD